MYLRTHRRKKDGKDHRYFSVVENRRLRRGKIAQRQVLYLGEINDSQQGGLAQDAGGLRRGANSDSPNVSLFPETARFRRDAVDSLQVKLERMELRRPRAFGDCWLACELWRQLGLDEFWQRALPAGRGERAVGEGAASCWW